MELGHVFFYTVIAVVSFVVYSFLKERTLYWKKRGVPHDKPSLLVGNMGNTKSGKRRFLFEPVRDAYNKYKGTAPFCGFHFFLTPAVILMDLDLIKRVLIKDFNNFPDRRMFYNLKDDPLKGHLVALDGKRWRDLRHKLSPTFTSGKMKFMFPTVVEVGHRFAKVLSEEVGTGAVIEIKDLLARFTTDVIGTCAFGIECNSLKDPNAKFRVVGQRFFTTFRHNAVVMAFMRSCPDWARALRLRRLTDEVHNFFMGVVRETVEYREKNGIIRNDFMNMLIELKNTKSIDAETGEVISGLTMEELAAQTFIFFFAGFETSSTTMGFALYELATNQDIQDKLRNEVKQVLEKHNGVLSYESMKDMRYMDQVIFETLRKYTIASTLGRVAKEDYPIPGTNYKIEKGILIIVPADAIHHDPEIYPNPEVFDPERFSREEVEKRDPIAWLGFGDGPRNCIGLRFGKMQIRIGLSLLIKNFRFHISDQMQIPLQYNKKSQILCSDGGIHLRIEPIG